MKNIQKYITYIFIILFIVIFSIYNYQEYSNFHKSKILLQKYSDNINNKLRNFNLNQIKNIDDINLYYTPNTKLLTEIINKINNAKHNILIEVYMLTEKKIQNSLIKAHKKGINIKIILEKNPYKAYHINNKTYNKLKNIGINIVWSNKSNYSFNHSKIIIIDDLSIISTGNLSYSTFTKNRDFFIFTKNKNLNKQLRKNFNNDFIGNKINIYDNNLIFSPNSSRIKFEKMFDSAKNDIKMYFQYMKDDNLVNKLIKIKKKKNININIIIPITAKDDKNIILLKNTGINISILKDYRMHAKAILIDKKYLFIGSINFSNYSINKNREVGILIKNIKIIDNFLKIYNKDIKK